jgi:putative sterol carrier protein
MSDFDLHAAKPAEIYEHVAAIDEEDFDELMAEPEARTRVIDAMVEHMASLFRPEKAEGVDAVIHIKLWDRPGGGYDHAELRIADGECVVQEPSGDPDLTLKVRPGDLRKMITGETGARRLAFKGRLRAVGDIGLGLKLPDMFAF